MNETIKAAIDALEAWQAAFGAVDRTTAIIAEMKGWDLDALNKRADDAERVLTHAVETRDAYIDASITIYGKLYDTDGLMGAEVEADRLARDVCAYADAATKKLERTAILLRVAEAVVHGWDSTADAVDSVIHPDGAIINVRRVVDEMNAGTEPDTAVIECPVKCEVCGVVLPMAAALHTEDPVYLCGKHAADFAAHLEVDCGQDVVCAKPPGCQRHWAERNAELVAERDAEKARADAAEAMVCELRSVLEDARAPVEANKDGQPSRPANTAEQLLIAEKTIREMKAEFERMRPVVEAARDVRDEHMTDEPVMGRVMDRLIEAFRALDNHPGLKGGE